MQFDDATTKACQRAKAMEAMFECLKEVFAKAKTILAKAEVDLASERKKRESEVVKAKEELAKAKKRAEEKAIGEYKASMDFTTKKA